LYYYTFMREFQEKRFWRKVIYSRFSFIFLILVLAFMVYSAAKVYLRSRRASQANNLISQEIKSLEDKKNELQTSVERLQTQAGAEEEIRSKFPVQKPGEEAVVIVDQTNQNSPATSTSSLPSKIWEFIKNLF
jgi:uncharacterized protein YlxW (UPF0749 family)